MCRPATENFHKISPFRSARREVIDCSLIKEEEVIVAYNKISDRCGKGSMTVVKGEEVLNLPSATTSINLPIQCSSIIMLLSKSIMREIAKHGPNFKNWVMLNKFSIKTGGFVALCISFPGWHLIVESIVQWLVSQNMQFAHSATKGAGIYVLYAPLILIPFLSYLFGEIYEWVLFKNKTPVVAFLSSRKNQIPADIKKKIYDIIKDKFGIDLLNQKKKVGYGKADSSIRWAIKQIECQVRNHPNVLPSYRKMLFCRNLIGASILTLFITGINVFTGELEVHTALALSVIYACPLIVGKLLLKWRYKIYTECLLTQFLYENK